MSTTNTSFPRRESLDFYPEIKISKLYGRSKQTKDLQAHLTVLVAVLAGILPCIPVITLLNLHGWAANILCGVALIGSLVAANKFYNHLDMKQAIAEDDARMKESSSLVLFMRDNGYIVDKYIAENMLHGRYYSGITDLDGTPYVVMGASIWNAHFRFELRPDRKKIQRLQDKDVE